MTENDSSQSGASAGLPLLRPRGRPVDMPGLGEFVIYPPTVRTARALEQRFGEMLDGEAPDLVFDAYLGLAASLASAEPDSKGLPAAVIARLSNDHKAALASAGLVDLDVHEGTPGPQQPVAEYVARMAKQGDRVRKDRNAMTAKLKSLGMNAGSPSVRALEESNRASEFIKLALGPSLASQIASVNADIARPFIASQSRLAEDLRKAAGGTNRPWMAMPPRLDPDDYVTAIPPIDFNKPVREHQAKLENAAETVIALAEAALARINALADFAQTFQVDAAEGSRKNLAVAKWALVVSAALSLLQFGYSVLKDIHDGPKDNEQVRLLRDQNTVANQQLALLQQMLDDTRRSRHAAPPAAPVPVGETNESVSGPGSLSKPPVRPGRSVESGKNSAAGRRAGTAASSDPLRDGAT